MALLLVLLAFPTKPAFGQEATPIDFDDNRPATLTVEWIYSDEGRALTAMPSYRWLAPSAGHGERLLLREPLGSDDRRFLVLDPATRRRSELFSLSQANAVLERSFRGQAPTELEWPDAISASGQQLAWLIEGDLFAIDLSAESGNALERRFRRLTATVAEETSLQFAPDGRKLAYVRDNDLYLYDLDQRLERQLTSTGGETLKNGTLSWVYWEEIFARRDIGYWWSPDSTAIAFLESDESEVTISPFLDFEPESATVVEQRYPKTGGINPSVRVGVLELEEEGVTWVDLSGMEFEYLARVGWLPGAEALAVQTLSRDQLRLDLYRVERSSGEAAPLMTETDEAWVNLNDDLTFFEHGPRGEAGEFLWVSERTGYAHLYWYDDEGDERRALTGGEWALASSAGGPFWLRRAISFVDEERELVYFTSMRESSLERHLYRVALEGGVIERITQEPGTHRVAFSPSGRYYLDEFSATGTPPRLVLHAADGEPVLTLADSRADRVADLGLTLPELFRIPAGDGFQMPAEVTRPADFDAATRYPVILHVYGGPSAPTVANAWSNNVLFDNLLTRAGFVVVRVDNRSATAISKTLENLILKQGYGSSELSDLLDAVAWLKRQSWVDGDRVGIWGWSGGGTFTLLAMTGSDQFKAGISVAPVTDWKYYDTKWAESYMKLPSTNREGYESTSLVKKADALSGRLLLVHGTWDDNVHPQNSWAFIDALVEGNVPFEMMMYPRRKHGISDDAARRHLYNKMIEFWRRHL